MGFVLELMRLKRLAQDERHLRRHIPYQQDPNSHPKQKPSRYVINFDWPLSATPGSWWSAMPEPERKKVKRESVPEDLSGAGSRRLPGHPLRS